MTETLLLRLAENGQGIRDWLLFNDQGEGQGLVHSGPPDHAVIATARRIVALVPGCQVTLSTAQVPGRNRQRVVKAIPYALEDQLASDVEDLHFALGPAGEGNQYPVAVVAREQMDAWTGSLREQGIQANAMIPDMLALPLAGEGWSGMVEAGVTRVRRGKSGGFCCDNDLVGVLIGLQSDDDDLHPRLTLHGQVVQDFEGLDIEHVDEELKPLQVMARGLDMSSAIDLMQGDYSRREEWGRYLRPWKATAALLLAGLLLAGVSTGLDYYRLSAEQKKLTAAIEDVYRQAFPQSRRVVNPRAQMEQQLRSLQGSSGGGDTGFLALLAETANVLRGTRGISVQGASFRDGRLDLELQAENLQILDGLKQSLIASGRMSAEIQSATTESDRKVKSRIRIKGVRS